MVKVSLILYLTHFDCIMTWYINFMHFVQSFFEAIQTWYWAKHWCNYSFSSHWQYSRELLPSFKLSNDVDLLLSFLNNSEVPEVKVPTFNLFSDADQQSLSDNNNEEHLVDPFGANYHGDLPEDESNDTDYGMLDGDNYVVSNDFA